MLGVYTLFTQLDARSRFQEYKKVRDQLVRYGPDRRIFRSVAQSRCQRDAALAAARRLGHGAVCRAFFTAAGYRWYHLLPDFVYHRPRYLLSPAFYRATFFMPTYHGRYSTAIGTDSGKETRQADDKTHVPPERVNRYRSPVRRPRIQTRIPAAFSKLSAYRRMHRRA
jgi:hypothetical protein